jgi:hypothetical protein
MTMIKLKEHAIRDRWSFGISLQTPYESYKTDDYCFLTIQFFRHWFWFKIPQIIKPKEQWVYTSKWSDSKGYIKYVERHYGFSIENEALYVYYGIQPESWSSNDPENSDHSKVFFTFWNMTDRVRYDFLDLDGNFFISAKDFPNGRIDFDRIDYARKIVPKINFKFKDYDNQEIIATCYIEEMEWKYGVGFFKFMRLLRKPIIRRILNIDFSEETGPRKGDWKGGTVGTSIDISPGESASHAFKRYAHLHNFKDIEVYNG